MLTGTQIQETFKNKIILFGVLNWGLGHATRIVPLIKQAQLSAKKIIICSNGNSLLWLKNYFPEIETISLEAPEVIYGNNKYATLLNLFKLSYHYPKVLSSERNYVKALVNKLQINLIVSDNRPGIYYENIHNIYITHQLNIQAPFGLSALATKKHKQYYKNFNEIWVPDFEDDNLCLAGKLSRNLNNDQRVRYIGPLSRFNKLENELTGEFQFNLAIISGPEPQRALFEKQIIKLADKSDVPFKIVRGVVNGDSIAHSNKNIEFINSPYDAEFMYLVKCAYKIYCRSGYSTVMDLQTLDKLSNALLFPTPGQNEQEYLARYLKSKNNIPLS